MQKPHSLLRRARDHDLSVISPGTRPAVTTGCLRTRLQSSDMVHHDGMRFEA
jgi:hypothetical protein